MKSVMLGRIVLWTIPLWSCLVPQVRADVTLRYKNNVNMPGFLPPQAREDAEKAILGQAFSLQMKDGKSLSQFGHTTAIVDFGKQEITLLDAEHKIYATVRFPEFEQNFASMMPQMSEAAKQALASIKTSFASRMTGRTDTILGVQAEERENVISIEMPMPAGSPQAGFGMKLIMQIWTPKPEETLRVPAIRELTGYNLWANSVMNPAGMSRRMMSGLPGFGDSFGKITDELARNKAVMLRMSMSVYLPMSPELRKTLAEQSPSGPAIDPNAPIFQMTQEVTELSSGPVDAANFVIPEDYHTAPFEDLWQTMIKSYAPARDSGK